MHDAVGAAAQRQHGGNSVVERCFGKNVGRLDVLPHHLNNMLARQRGHLRVARVGRRDAGCAGQRQAQRLGRAGERAGRAHGHAMAGAAGNAVFYLLPILLRDVARPQLGPVLPSV